VSLTARHPDLWCGRCGSPTLFPTRLDPRRNCRGLDHLPNLQEIFRMNRYDYIIEALDIISAWNISDENLADAINEQARLMACVDHDNYLDTLIDILN
jgi:hypothetical protein